MRERGGPRRALGGSKEAQWWWQGQMAQAREREGPRRVPGGSRRRDSNGKVRQPR